MRLTRVVSRRHPKFVFCSTLRTPGSGRTSIVGKGNNQGRVTRINPPHGLGTTPPVQGLARPPIGGSRPRAPRRPSVGRHRARSRRDPFRDRRAWPPRRGGPDTITPGGKALAGLTFQPTFPGRPLAVTGNVARMAIENAVLPVFLWPVSAERKG